MRQLAFETSGSLQARSVSLMAAGNVNSSQLAIVRFWCYSQPLGQVG